MRVFKAIKNFFSFKPTVVDNYDSDLYILGHKWYIGEYGAVKVLCSSRSGGNTFEDGRNIVPINSPVDKELDVGVLAYIKMCVTGRNTTHTVYDEHVALLPFWYINRNDDLQVMTFSAFAGFRFIDSDYISEVETCTSFKVV